MFMKNYRQKVVLWEGTVLRVDSFDKGGPEYMNYKGEEKEIKD